MSQKKIKNFKKFWYNPEFKSIMVAGIQFQPMGNRIYMSHIGAEWNRLQYEEVREELLEYL